ncbi:MAG: Ig-like domain-containing protein [Blastocatellia bacterium]|nr:Ig-like domain-containing protein [Blastocatellia bacterium]
MSYMDLPRLHFAGEFFADPPTYNNTASNYNPASAITPLWNANGTHYFIFQNCTVKRTLNNAGTVSSTSAADALVGGNVEISGTIAAQPKLVDIDTEMQTVSQIWGLELKVSLSSGTNNFTCKMQTATLRDLWSSRAPGGFARGFGGVYQSVLTDITWSPAAGSSTSTVFDQLRTASPTKLSIKFVLYNYEADPAQPKFKFGKIVGTIGPVLAGEPDHLLAARRLEPSGKNATSGIYGGPFGPAPFKVDSARNKLVIDLGNAVPESTPGGSRRSLGTMNAQIFPPPAFTRVILGAIDYSRAHYEETAGIEEVTLTAAQVTQLASVALSIGITGPPPRQVLTERPSITYLDATEIAFRLNPGESKTIELVATELGAPKSTQRLGLRLRAGRTSAGLTFPASVTTGANGKASVTFTASDPGHPRTHIDGQLYFVEFDWGVAALGAAPDHRGNIIVRVFDPHAAVASPTWAHVQAILTEYARLYPMMKGRMDLSDHATVRTNKDSIKTTLSYPETDPRYMPVSRDLSRDKKALIIRWINRGAP